MPGAAPRGGTATALSLRVLVLALLGGLILNLMPCVFPVLGIKVVGFINQAGGDRRKVTMHGLAFTAGVLLSFWALAQACWPRCEPVASSWAGAFSCSPHPSCSCWRWSCSSSR